MVEFGDGADQGQSKSGTIAFSGRISAVETIENVLLRFCSDAGAIVFNLQNGRATLLLEGDINGPAAGRILDRVLGQIENEPEQQGLVTVYP